VDLAANGVEHVAYDGVGWTAETVASGSLPSLALGAGGAVHIAFYDDWNGTLEHGWLGVVDLDCDGLPGE
jgi:hypothetical protein